MIGELSRQKCPKTCGLCGMRAAAGCEDDEAALKTNMGQSKCADVQLFCTDETHGPNARKYCPKTCNSCPTAAANTEPSIAPSTPSSAAPTLACVDDDEGAKSLGAPNCAGIAGFCQDPRNGVTARKHCPKTCDSCPTASPSAAPSAESNDDAGAKTLGAPPNCAAAAGFCTDEKQGANARKYCPKTCDSCPTAPAPAPAPAPVCEDDLKQP